MQGLGTRYAFIGLSLLFLLMVLAIFVDDATPEWHAHQAAYREWLVARADTPEHRNAARRTPIDIKQIVVVETGAVDRCVTCHVAVDDPSFVDAPLPLTYHADHDQHPFPRFGCTVCHGGQGRAVTKDAAHGRVEHWERPLLPLRFVEASCGKCHFPRGLKAAPKLTRGRALFEEKGCRGCHKLDGVGGVIGPDLTTVARAGGRTPEWLMAHFRNPQEVVPNSAMPRLDLDESEVEALTMYLLSRTDERFGAYFLSQRFVPTAETGQELFEEKGCVGCHTVKGIGGNVGPALDDVAKRHDAEWLFQHFKDPRALMPSTVMPMFDFTDGEAKALTLFVLSLKEDSDYRPADIGALQSPEERGRELFKRFGCIGCHGPGAEGGIANPNSATAGVVPGLRYVAEGYTADELAQRILNGQLEIPREDPAGQRPPLYMPAWRGIVTEAQVRDLTAYLFSLMPEGEEEEW